MKCFYHADAEAVGSCKNCQRGLCRACAEHSQNSLACPNRCEDAVSKIDNLVATNVKIVSSSNSMLVFLLPALFLVAGIAILAVAWLSKELLISIIGGVFFLFGVIRLITISRYRAMRS